MRPRFLALFLTLTVSVALAAPLPAATGDVLETERKGAPTADRFWVFFEDKGISSGERAAALAEARAVLTERALTRRARVGMELNENDLPVAEAYVDAVAGTGVEIVTRSRWLNAVSVRADDTALAALAAFPFVREVRPVARGTKELPEITPAQPATDMPAPRGRELDYGSSQSQLEQIQVPLLHDDGFDGGGVLIAMLDTGFDTDHEAFRHLDIVGERDFINDDTETANELGDPSGQDSHGTATLSCVGAMKDGVIYGGSYNASFLLAKTEIVDQEIQVEEDYWVEAVEWADSLGADVVSSSLGYLYWYTYEDMDGGTAVTTVAADMAAARGLLCVNSMGNEGNDPWLYMIAPADGDSVLSVGAVDSSGVRTAFSSVGPTYDGRIKPDVMALGLYAFVATTADTASYGSSSGTSFSCPLTAGAVGLLLQGHPDWTPCETITALRSTGTMSSSPDTLMGWGIVQAHDAMYSAPLDVPEESGSERLIVLSRPNPSSGATTLSFTTERAGRVRVSVHDVAGRRVNVLADRLMPAGPVSLTWDGTGSDGRRAASGIYFLRVEAPERTGTSRIALLR
ncbi:MAG: S8 family serine peptidase [Candidatus Eisenbacteria bacterium]|nr:S8 family serine peptidase [Candidatus Eisenbacteria bacterium]